MNTNRQNNKPRLILLSDLWGKEKSDWLTQYTTLLEKHFDVHYYDSCELAAVDKSNYTEEQLHTQFLNGGIDKAVEALLQKEKEAIYIIGFSIGGTIAWKASFLDLNVSTLFTVSSTRLRYETQKPSETITLFFGEDDHYKPNFQWFEKMQLKEHLFKNEAHEFYQKKEIAAIICQEMIKLAGAN